ncbi:unnamed protein product [Trichogramma brassicae]|uniref:Uncharacterized protein n=1 Tax=Trichogramma brassicae TaxID=86971 RepID=A0A6H5J2F5_9HYME|nr:unnamed protein product [Trichogramma brassicae]
MFKAQRFVRCSSVMCSKLKRFVRCSSVMCSKAQRFVRCSSMICSKLNALYGVLKCDYVQGPYALQVFSVMCSKLSACVVVPDVRRGGRQASKNKEEKQ